MMPVRQTHYEESLADYSNLSSTIALLKQHRPYLEMLPSLRRADESLVILPLPVARVKQSASSTSGGVSSIPPLELRQLPCDLAILMCDPDWKVKAGIEIFVFIHRPQEELSDLLNRWRQTQVWLDRGYQWELPPHQRHILGEEANDLHPLFILFPETPDRIKRGLKGACLPFVVRAVTGAGESEVPVVAQDSQILEEIEDWESGLFPEGNS
ncbi:MAG: hypothetical protein SFW36_14810 [Leptolyngbyaceae cyanobacterium bins.59]|nr:hypothetical protein [Leptolyngbyaceae cyanobacterium bins.59]